MIHSYQRNMTIKLEHQRSFCHIHMMDEHQFVKHLWILVALNEIVITALGYLSGSGFSESKHETRIFKWNHNIWNIILEQTFFQRNVFIHFFSLSLVTQIQIFELFNIIECCTNFFSSKKSTIEVNNSYKYTTMNKKF